MKALLLFALVLSGCTQGSVTGVRPVVLAADSVRWVQEEKDQPYALTWADGTVNLWVRMDSRMTSTTYPYTESQRYKYSAVYRGRLSPNTMAVGTLTGVGALENCTVTDGSFWVMDDGDTLLRGLVLTTVATPCCGARVDSLWLRLARVSPTEGT